MKPTRNEDIQQKLLDKREIDPSTGCWLWRGGVDGHGYGAISIQGKQYVVSRLSFPIFLGIQLDSKTCVLHRCDTPRCFNPDHLFLGTREDNSRDMIAKGRSGVGESNGRAKLTQSDVLRIRQLLQDGESLTAIGKMFDVTDSTISKIKRGVNWSNI